MATLAELDLRVDARQPERAADVLDRLAVAGDRADASADRLAGSSAILAREARQAASAGDLLGRALGGIGFGLLVTQAGQLADAYTGMQNRLGLATDSTMQLAKASEDLFKVAQDTRVGLEATVDLYASLERSTKSLGLSQDRLLGVTETINQAMIISGASAGAAQAALVQLGQGFASGTLRGEELNSILEQTPRLAKAIADGLGVSVGELRKLGAEGELTGKKIVGALEGQADEIGAEFGDMTATISQSFVKMQNSVLRYVGEADQAAGTSRRFAEAIEFAADNFDELADAAVKFGAVALAGAGILATRYVTSLVATTAAGVAATASNVALGAAISGMSARAAAGAVSMRALSVAMGFFGGPIGLAITAVAAGVGYLAWESAKARAETERLANELGGTKTALDEYEKAALDAAGKTGDARTEALKHAEALGAETRAALAAASALREKRVALAEAEAAEKEVRKDRNLSIMIGAMAGAGSGFPTAALAGAIPEAQAAKRVADAKKEVALYTKEQADAEKRYASILAMLSNPAAAVQVAETEKATGAAKSRASAMDELARAAQRATDAATDYLARLKEENAEYGRTAIQIKAMEIAAEEAAAPTAALKAQIAEQGDYALGFLKGAEAIRELNAAASEFKERPNPDFVGPELDGIAEELRLIDGIALDAGRGMEQAFGGAGRALGGLATALSGYRSQMAEFARFAHERGLDEATRIREERSLRIGAYGDMAYAGREFFKEGSAGYELMAGAEKAFRLVEFGLAMQAIATKGAEAAATVTAEATMTSATLAGTAVRTPAKAAEGIAGIFAALGPFAFPVAAAATAVMVAAGVKAFGGGGGGVPGAMDMENRQKRQGTGSVLGDASAKTESLVRSMALVEEHTNRDLEFSNEMVKSLRSIDDQIGVVAAALARGFSAGGMLDTSDLNLGSVSQGPGLLSKIINPLSAVLPGLFGSKTTRTLQDQGIELMGGALSDILAGGLTGNAYQQVLEQTKKKAFGITYSNKSRSTTTTSELDDDFLRQTTLLIGSLRDGVLSAAGALGIEGADAALASFQVQLGKLSFKDMDPAEIQAELEAIFGKVADDMAGAVLPGLGEFQKAGEGLFETLTRVSRQYQVVDLALSSVGMTFGQVGVASLAAREHLVDLFGGLDAFTEQTQFFAETFLTEAERLAPIQAAVAKEMARLGLSSVDTRDEFKALVLGLDVSTKAGADLYAALMAVAPAFAKVTEESQAVVDARDVLASAYERESSALQSTIDKFKGFSDSLKTFRDSLYSGPAAMLSPEAQYQASKAEFERVAAAARAGDEKAIGDLQSVSQAYLDASKEYYASSAGYFRDLEAVRAAVTATQGYAQSQASAAERELAALDKQVEAHLETNRILLSVHQAILNLELAKASTGQGGGAGPGGRAFDGSDYLDANPDVMAAFQKYLANDPAFMAASGYAPGMTADQFGERHWNDNGQYEGRKTFVMPAAAPAAKAVSNDNSKVEAKLAEVVDEVRALVRQNSAGTPAMLQKLDTVADELAANTRAQRQMAAY